MLLHCVRSIALNDLMRNYDDDVLLALPHITSTAHTYIYTCVYCMIAILHTAVFHPNFKHNFH